MPLLGEESLNRFNPHVNSLTGKMTALEGGVKDVLF
jgi:hypothetical protein